MKSFDKIFLSVIALLIFIISVGNLLLTNRNETDENKAYRVEITRLTEKITNGDENPDLSEYKYVINTEKYSENDSSFYKSIYEYEIREIDGCLYKFEYVRDKNSINRYVIVLNISLLIMSAVVISLFIFIRTQLISPFEKLSEVPYQLSKGNLTAPLKETKSRFFGKFIWGINLLRENMEQQKQRELALIKENNTMVMSLSHDIKTPLSAIKLYSKALSKGLYPDKEKQLSIAESIDLKADEIGRYVSEIIKTSNDDFLLLEVKNGEFYLSELITNINDYYKEKLSLIHTGFIIEEYGNCILSGDIDRSIEVLQNIIENAVKYGDGKLIEISFGEDDGYQLVTVSNSGCSLPRSELSHIFESFWRGSNTENKDGSGLGLYICKKLMNKMKGEIYADIKNDTISVTSVFKKA